MSDFIWLVNYGRTYQMTTDSEAHHLFATCIRLDTCRRLCPRHSSVLIQHPRAQVAVGLCTATLKQTGLYLGRGTVFLYSQKHEFKYSLFHENGSFSVYSFNEHYKSPSTQVAEGTVFRKHSV